MVTGIRGCCRLDLRYDSTILDSMSSEPTQEEVGLLATPSGSEHLRPADLLVAVCDGTHERLTASPPAQPLTRPTTAVGRGWLHWAIADPVSAGTDEAFETAYADIDRRVTRLAHALAPV